jgi:hypothetical protein
MGGNSMSGRYSGMRDKHGIDIAEGDILQRDEDDLEFVKTIAIFGAMKKLAGSIAFVQILVNTLKV